MSSAYNVSTVRDSEKFNYDECEIDYGLPNEYGERSLPLSPPKGG